MMADDKQTITGTVSPAKQWYNDKVSKAGKPYQNFKFTMVVTQPDGSTKEVVCIAWYELAKPYKDYLKVGTQVTATGKFEANTWQGETTLQFKCSDIQGTPCAPQTGQMNLGDTPSLPMIKPGSADPDDEDTLL